MWIAGKPLSELVQLEQEIRDLLRTSDSIDPEYWTRVLDNLEIEKLKTKVRTIQTEIQKAALDFMGPSAKLEKVFMPLKQTRLSCALKVESKAEANDPEEKIELDASEEDVEVECTEACPSPEPITSFEGKEVIPEDEDYDQIAVLRRQVCPTLERPLSTLFQVKLRYSDALKKQAKEAAMNVRVCVFEFWAMGV